MYVCMCIYIYIYIHIYTIHIIHMYELVIHYIGYVINCIINSISIMIRHAD